jgi:hypothetical protein
MKKIALATLLALVAVTASAVEVGVEFQNQLGKNNGPKSDNYQLSVKQAVNDNFAVDVKTLTVVGKSDNAETGLSSSQLEAGVTGKYNAMGLATPYVRIGLGERYTTTTNYSYYSIEPGVNIPVASTGVTATVAWRYRAPFDQDANQWETRTWRAALGYNITKADNVYVGYDRMRGDTQAGLTRVGYAHSF